MKLLVVDSSKVTRRKIARAVETIGFYEVAEASNSDEALQVYNAVRPGIVTVDITMPDREGIACIQKLKAEDPGVLILALSTAESQDIANEATTLGARGILEAPFSDEQICSSVQNVMAKAVNETGFRKIPDFNL